MAYKKDLKGVYVRLRGIGKLFEKKYGGLVFALLSGAAYFIIVLGFILNNTTESGGLLGFFFAPAIICGAGLVLLKTVNHLKETEEYGKINVLCWAHVVLFIMSIIFLIEMI